MDIATIPTKSTAASTVRRWLEAASERRDSDNYQTKRGEPRFTWTEALELLVAGRVHYVYALNVSETGVAITCREKVRVGEQVYLRRSADEAWVPGRVAHVTETVGNHKIGLQLSFFFEG